jgi:putative ABC transport system substrate-binding protein
VRRRWFVTGLAAVFVAPRGAHAQPSPAPIIGVLAPHLLNPHISAFFDGLRELGYEDGRTARIVTRSADGDLARLPALAAALVRMKPDVIVAVNTPGVMEAMKVTATTPIVMVNVADPVATGIVPGLARPGGMVTGVTNFGAELAGKRVQVLKELVPGARRIAVLYNPKDPVTAPPLPETERAAAAIGIEVRFYKVEAHAALPGIFEAATAWRADAATWLAGQQSAYIDASNDLSRKRRLPLMVVSGAEVERGSLISYFVDTRAMYRRAAVYVDRILKGARPGDLPIEQPTTFELTINLRTAKAIGLTIPPALLLRADRLIE